MQRPPGTVISEKGTQLAPLNAKFDMISSSGDSYRSTDVLTLPKPVQIGQALPPVAYSVLMGNPNSSENLSSGAHITAVNHLQIAQLNRNKPTKRRPKSSVKGNKSSFINRGLVFDNFAKRMKPDDLSDCLVLMNYERTLNLLDFGTNGVKIEPLAKLFFKNAWPLCHCLNYRTAGAAQLDVVIGMSSGDLLWLDIATQRYERVNKFKQPTSAILALAWFPYSENLVAAAHANGLLIIYDLHADDPIKTSFRIGPRTTSLVFLSPSELLVASHNDYVKLIHLDTPKLLNSGSIGSNLGCIQALIPSLFGGVLTLSVSPDGKFWACGGVDGMISIYEAVTKQLIVRLTGHRAWIKSVVWDLTTTTNEDVSTYRLATVGEDRQVMLWDLAPSTLSPPNWKPQVEIAEDQQFVARTHTDGTIVVHGRVLQSEAPQISPVSHCKPQIPEYGESAITSVVFTNSRLLVTSNDGRVFTWTKKS